jgi:hypothetical protein
VLTANPQIISAGISNNVFLSFIEVSFLIIYNVDSVNVCEHTPVWAGKHQGRPIFSPLLASCG